jgi:hypothetical protein
MHQPKNSQRTQSVAQAIIGGPPIFNGDDQPHAEEGQPIKEKYDRDDGRVH